MTEHIHAHDHPESDRVRSGGFTLWFTGLSGSGKSTIAHLVGPELDRRGLFVEYLDGDTVRTHLSKGLGFSKEDRDTNIERIGWVASRITRQGGAVIAAAISPYEETRAKARGLVEEFGPFVEVYVNASVDECARRDVNGLYAKAFAGEIKGFTGVDDPYEEPESRRNRRRHRDHRARGGGGAGRREARGARVDRGRGASMSSVAAIDRLIAPHGGTLVDRTGDAPDDLDALEIVSLTSRELSDLDMIASGALSPLEGFMGRADYERVIEEMHLASGLPWALPVCLAVDAAPAGDRVALADESGRPVAVLEVERGLRVRQGARGRALLPDDGRGASWGRAPVRPEAALPRRSRDRVRASRSRSSPSSRATRPRRGGSSPSAAGSGSSGSRRATRFTARTST